MKDDALLIMVLDKSGSMGQQKQATIDGFNAFVEEQMKLTGNTWITLTLFDSTAEVRFEGIDINTLPAMGTRANPFQPQGNTALYDGVGQSIQSAEAWLAMGEVESSLAGNPPFDGRVICMIWTDGGENSSKLWKLDALNDLIKRKADPTQTNPVWEFAFLGSGEAAWTEGQKLAAVASTTMNYAKGPGGQSMAYASATASVTRSRTYGSSLVDSWVVPDPPTTVSNP